MWVSGNRSRAMTHMAEWDRNSSAPPPDPHQMHTQSPGPPTLTSHIVPSYISELRIYVCNRNSSFGAATCGGSGILHTHTHMGHNGAFVMDWWISSVTFSHYENVARFLLVWLLSAAPISTCHLPLATCSTPRKMPLFPTFLSCQKLAAIYSAAIYIFYCQLMSKVVYVAARDKCAVCGCLFLVCHLHRHISG